MEARLDLVIVGGESGPGARRCDVEWIGSVVRQCKEAGVACFVKQLGANVIANGPLGHLFHRYDGKQTTLGWRARLRDPKGGDQSEWPADLRVRQFPEVRP